MTATLDLTQDDVLTVLRSFLLDILPVGIEVVEGRVNRVPMVKAPDFVIITPTHRQRLSWNIVNPEAYDTPVQAWTKQPTQISVQVDVYGPDSAENAQLFSTLFQDAYACEFFARQPKAVAPLTAGDPMRVPFVNAEAQYEDRWVIDAMLQANPVATTVQDYADVVIVDLIEVDTTYPPGA